MLKSTLMAARVAAIALAATAVSARADTTSVTVSGDDNPFLAGQPNGTACCSGGSEGTDTVPAQAPTLAVSGFATGAGNPFTFSGTGGFLNFPGTPSTTLDGDSLYNMEASYSTFAISGATNIPFNSLVGVFLGDLEPDGTPPGPLNFSSTTFSSLAPGLGQIFFIGDGLTGTGSGAIQQFFAPTGATRLFLGTADSYGWANNSGTANITINFTSAAPEPGTWAMMIAGFGIAGVALRRRRTPAKRALA